MRSQGAAYSLFKYCRDLHSTLHISRLTISTEVRHMFHLLIFQIRTMSANGFDFRVDLTYLNISSKCHECWWPGFLEISSFLLMKWQEFLDNRFQVFSILRDDKFEFTVIPDRAQGGSSLESGSIELMLLRIVAKLVSYWVTYWQIFALYKQTRTIFFFFFSI